MHIYDYIDYMNCIMYIIYNLDCVRSIYYYVIYVTPSIPSVQDATCNLSDRIHDIIPYADLYPPIVVYAAYWPLIL